MLKIPPIIFDTSGDNDYGNGDDDCSDDENNDGGEPGCFWDELNIEDNGNKTGNKNENEKENNNNNFSEKNDNLMDNMNGDVNGGLNINGGSPRGKNGNDFDPFQVRLF